MTNVDQFESVFRAAAKEVFVFDPVGVGSALVITDLDPPGAARFAEGVQRFLSVLPESGGTTWRVVSGDEFRTVPDLLALVEAARPDLVCTYRHLKSEGWKWPFTLGDHVEVLTQVLQDTPVMILPHPAAERALAHALQDTNTVMAITDHLTGDHRLVNWAARLVEPGGLLFLAHVEDEATFERYAATIGRIPAIDTDVARAEIRSRLLKEPGEYIGSCRTGLEAHGVSLEVREIVTLGRRLAEYRRLIDEHEIDLLVFNTKDEDQLAMHGLAYPLAVELREIPLLML